MSNDFISILDKPAEVKKQDVVKPWKVAIIDDEEQIHDVTKMVLGSYKYAGRPLEFISAYSAKEGEALFQQHNDIAVCLLDVVMESETAGLDLVKTIRRNNNDFTRIVLRTGQPGQAPEEEVISRYDINDYKEKTELTRTKLITLMHSCLKTYEFIINQEQTRLGLEKVLESTAKIFENPFVKDFATGVMMQFLALFEVGENAAFVKVNHAMAAYEESRDLQVIAGIGGYAPDENNKTELELPDHLMEEIVGCKESFKLYHDENFLIGYHLGKTNAHYILALHGELHSLSDFNLKIISLFCHNALIAFENISLNNEVEEAQVEMVYLLSGAVESRSKETGNHIKRVAEVSALLALSLGLDESDAKCIRWASPLHDIGKIAIPDKILNKPGKLTEEEWVIMRTHAEEGYKMLSGSNKKFIKTASLIARDHHEKWNGDGYPRGLKGDDISIEGRITAVADVFDALCSKRCYKDAWSFDDAFDFMQEQSGKHFDPAIIEAFNAKKSTILEIYQTFTDV
jgi:putative nucleotidyltransferase with HDIG domain